jgi:hypothetical protein
MSVIAWDGQTIAADRQATNEGLAFTTTKMRRIKRDGHIPEVIAWIGDQDAGEMMAQWYEFGANPTDFPVCQKDKDDWARLIVADQYGVKLYERYPVAIRIEDEFSAWGSGRDFAIAALYLGKTAREAVEVACALSIGCGNGITELNLS